MGVCCVIKVLSVIIFLIDWWLIRNRQNAEKKSAALTVGEVVNSIISLDKREFRNTLCWLGFQYNESWFSSRSGEQRCLDLRD